MRWLKHHFNFSRSAAMSEVRKNSARRAADTSSAGGNTTLQNHALARQFLGYFGLVFPGTISESQHTGCTHRVLPALAGGVAPTTP